MIERVLPGLAGFLLGCCIAGEAVAQAPAAEPDPTSAAASEPLRVSIVVSDGELSAESLLAAIQRELERPVTLVTSEEAALQVLVSSRRAELVYKTASDEGLARSVDLPEDRAEAVEVVGLLAGNLVRNEADELLAALRARASAVAGSEAAPDPPEAATNAAPPLATPPVPSPTGPADAAARPAAEGSVLTNTPVQLALYSPNALYRDGEQRRFLLALGAAYMRVGGIDGAAVSLGVLRVDQAVRGLAFSGLWNRFTGPVSGIDVSGVVAEARGALDGVGVSGIGSFRQGRVLGAQLGGLIARTHELRGLVVAGALTTSHAVEGASAAGLLTVAHDVDGFLLAGGATVSDGVSGAAAAGVFNLTGEADGLLIAGALNVARSMDGWATAGAVNLARAVRGVAIAGVANLTGDLSGLAIAPVNVGGRVDGVQFGVINVASEMNGAAVGLINIAGNGRVQPMVWFSNLMALNAGVRFQSGYSYSILAAGLQEGADMVSFEGGLGAKLPVVGPLSVAPGVHYSQTQDPGNLPATAFGEFHYRATVELSFGRAAEVFVGGGVRHRAWGETPDLFRAEVLAGVAAF